MKKNQSDLACIVCGNGTGVRLCAPCHKSFMGLNRRAHSTIMFDEDIIIKWAVRRAQRLRLPITAKTPKALPSADSVAEWLDVTLEEAQLAFDLGYLVQQFRGPGVGFIGESKRPQKKVPYRVLCNTWALYAIKRKLRQVDQMELNRTTALANPPDPGIGYVLADEAAALADPEAGWQEQQGAGWDGRWTPISCYGKHDPDKSRYIFRIRTATKTEEQHDT